MLFNMKNTITIQLDGMECSTCVMNIDGVMEDQDGVFESRTSYAKQQTSITFDSKKVSAKTLVSLLTSSGYKAQLVA